MTRDKRKESAFNEFRKTHNSDPKSYSEIEIQGHYWSITTNSETSVKEVKEMMRGFAELKKELESC